MDATGDVGAECNRVALVVVVTPNLVMRLETVECQK